MVLHNAQVTGSLTLNNVNISGVTGSAAASASFASQIASLNAYTASANASFSSIETATGSLNTFSGSVLSYTSSANARLLSIETATASLNAFSGSILSYTASANARLLSIETATGSLNTYTGSNNATIASISANIASLSAGSASAAVTVSAVSQSVVSLNVYTASNDATVNSLAQATVLNAASIASLTSVTRSYATTGSNTFVAPQFINQASNAISFTSTASLYTDGGARVGKDLFVSGTTYVNNLTVYGTSSIQYITSSQVNIGTNIITVNTDTPAVRFGGLAVFDSGSTGLTGSMLWDSETNHWVYSNPSGSTYSGGMIMSGPRSSALGSEQGTTNNALMKGQGGDHITSSAITENGTLTSMYSTMYVSSSGVVSIGTTSTYYSNNLIIAAGSEGGITIANPSTTGAQYIMFADGTSGNDRFRGYMTYNHTDNSLSLATDANIRLTINSSGNAGLGVTPSAWETTWKVIQLAGGSVYVNAGGTTGQIGLAQNWYYDGSQNRYLNSAAASDYYQFGGSHIWRIAAAGTAGNAISFTQAMTLNASGNLSIGNTNDTYKLDVSGTGRFRVATNQNVRISSETNTSIQAVNDAANAYVALKLDGSSLLLNSQSGGNVGIGTTSVSGTYEKLAVAGGISIKDNTNAKLEIGRYNTTGAQNSYIKLGANSNSLRITNNTDVADILELTNSGNLGLGVTPSAWSAAYVALQIGGVGSLSTTTGGATFTHLTNGAHFNGTNWIYTYTSVGVARYTLTDSGGGTHQWFTSPNSGTAGGTISFTQAMTLNASGNLSIGNTNNTYKLDVTGTARFTGQVTSEDSFYAVATPPATNGGLVNVRDTVTATNVTSFAGVFFNSAPGSDYSIGKLTENNAGFLQIRNGNNGNELLRINSTGVATFASSVNALQFTATDGYGLNVGNFQVGAITSNRFYIYNNTLGIDNISIVPSTGITTFARGISGTTATFNSNVGASTFNWNSGIGALSWSSGYVTMETNSATDIALVTNSVRRLNITSGGNIGIGTTSPSRALTVASDTSFYNGASGAGAIDPGAQEVLTTGFNVVGQSSLDISNIDITLNKWKAIVRGGFANNNEGGGLVSSGLEIEVDSNSPSIPVGSSSITFSRNSSTGKLQVTCNLPSNLRITFVGTIQIINYPQSAPPTISKIILGSVGIGTTNPLSRLHVQASEPNIRIVDTDDSGVMFIGNSGGYSYIRPFSRDFRFLNAAGSSLMAIASGGNVGIGTTSPGEKLEVDGTIKATQLSLGDSYNNTITTDSSWSSFQTVIPTNTLEVFTVYLITASYSVAAAPYNVVTSFTFVVPNGNGGGVDNEFLPICATHQGGTGTMSFRAVAGSSQQSCGLQIKFTGFSTLTGSLKLRATILKRNIG